MTRRTLGLACALLAAPAVGGAQVVGAPYRDATAPVEARVADLLGRMTPAEKFWQLFMLPGDRHDPSHDYRAGVFGLQVVATDSSADAAAAHGLVVDTVVAAGETPVGRPSPLMNWQAMIDLAVWPAAACVVVDDTLPGITAGLAAGAWTVGVAATGNAVGLSEADYAALDPDAQAAHLAQATAELTAAGAHAVIGGIGELEPLLDDFEALLAAGKAP